MSDRSTMTPLTELEMAAKRVMATPVADEDVPDWLARVRKVERDLGEYRRELLGETPDVAGEHYEIVTHITKKASFNPSAILYDLLEATNLNVLTLLRELVDAGALKLSFVRTKLVNYMHKRGVDVRVASHEIADEGIDGPHIGIVVTERREIKAREDETDAER